MRAELLGLENGREALGLGQSQRAEEPPALPGHMGDTAWPWGVPRSGVSTGYRGGPELLGRGLRLGLRDMGPAPVRLRSLGWWTALPARASVSPFGRPGDSCVSGLCTSVTPQFQGER